MGWGLLYWMCFLTLSFHLHWQRCCRPLVFSCLMWQVSNYYCFHYYSWHYWKRHYSFAKYLYYYFDRWPVSVCWHSQLLSANLLCCFLVIYPSIQACSRGSIGTDCRSWSHTGELGFWTALPKFRKGLIRLWSWKRLNSFRCFSMLNLLNSTSFLGYKDLYSFNLLSCSSLYCYSLRFSYWRIISAEASSLAYYY